MADSEAALFAHVADLEGDNAILRELLVASFDALRDLTLQHDRIRRTREDLIESHRLRRIEALVQAGVEDTQDAQ